MNLRHLGKHGIYREPVKGSSQVVRMWGEKLRSPACNKQTKRNFCNQFHRTWDEPFSAALYVGLIMYRAGLKGFGQVW